MTQNRLIERFIACAAALVGINKTIANHIFNTCEHGQEVKREEESQEEERRLKQKKIAQLPQR